MIRTFAPLAFAALSFAGCAANAPQHAPVRYSGPVAPQQPQYAPQVANSGIFANAPYAGVHGELTVCGGNVSNSGPIGPRGESQLYTPYIYTSAGALLRNPAEVACLSSGFGYRGSATGGGRNHTGLDLANRGGGFIFAAGPGRVVDVGHQRSYGNIVEIDHGYGVHTFYAHLQTANPALQPGSWVEAGAPIGLMGQTGNATGIHLHYELMIDGQKVDPLTYGWQSPVYDGPNS